VPLIPLGLWLGLSLLLIALALAPLEPRDFRWPVSCAVVVVLGGSLALVWGSQPDPLARWRGGFSFDELAHLLLPPLWTGMAGVLISSQFLHAGHYEPAIASLSTTAATAGILAGNALFMVAMLQAAALIILCGLLVNDQGLAVHPLLNVATALKYVTLTIVSAACLVMGLLLGAFYAINPDRLELPRIIAVLLVIGFGLAVGAVPFYFHIPDLFDAAPTLAIISFAGPLQCLAFTYLIRSAGNAPWLLADDHVAGVLVVGAAFGALLTSVMAFGQRRLNRLLAFNALREISWIMLGIASLSRAGWAGALIFLAGRCIAQPLLLIIASVAQARGGQAEVEQLGGLARVLPLATVAWIAAALASAGAPPTAGFWGLERLVQGSFGISPPMAILLLASAALAAWRLAHVTLRTFWGLLPQGANSAAEAPVPAWTFACTAGGLMFAGFVPRLLNTPVDHLLASFPFLR
jgi:formate hydrogenlyase subunit 3/multisubunit Na+/H+ antiporter MnhD subunit